ncbi:glycosyltransferase [Rugamonas apoptosis]|uniref:Glycosyltransferase n=1 Tax=Rugamonas apoptosis TaxID=2758570 RepID=A0A7W2FEN2_9BURK|nr:glycosyltransferase [Rugamonas apoptosis]MBA5690295.1 glycosyltransferase [Rugamonas apoptosis]
MQRKRILFVAEAVTLAHVGRPLALAGALDTRQYELHFACAPGHQAMLAGTTLTYWPIASIPGAQFLAALAAGRPVYDEPTLRRYVEDDRRLLAEVRPDLVVGDFRLSLSISARLARVPYVTVSNAYWSPYVRQHYRVPAIPLARHLPLALADGLFRLVRPLAFAAHTVPLNRVRRLHGLPSLGWDLRRVYTDADWTAYADIPELFPPEAMPSNHRYLGPVTWSPPVAPPPWWDSLPAVTPLVYVTLGSSGQGTLLPMVLEGLADLPVTVMAATAGKAMPAAIPDNARVASYLPGDEAARRASLVVCNGGSPTSQQGLTAAVPVLGIAGNLDQFLNMQGVVAAGAGALLRADRLTAGAVRRAAADLLNQPQACAAALRVAQQCRRYPAGERFAALLASALATPAGPLP